MSERVFFVDLLFCSAVNFGIQVELFSGQKLLYKVGKSVFQAFLHCPKYMVTLRGLASHLGGVGRPSKLSRLRKEF